MKSYRQSFEVSFSYPVLFARDVFHPDNPALAEALPPPAASPPRCLVFIDENVARCHPGLSERLRIYAARHADRVVLAADPAVVPGGEAIKNDYRKVMEIVDRILEYRLCRHSFVAAVGGGAVLDAVGFAASIVHRGIRLLRFPTTVLAQNDAGLGVKNGLNLHGGKNTVGAFAPPYAVINDVVFLETLPDTEWRGGVSEAFKVACIKDRAFFEWLCGRAEAFRDRDLEAMRELIERCARLHLDHIRASGDPFESGRSRPLDFGHWAAHKLESMSGYRIGHGAAVGMGLALDAAYAARMGWIREKDFELLYNALRRSGLPLWDEVADRRLGDGSHELLQGIEEFREHLGGQLCIAFPDGIGALREERRIDASVMTACLDALANRARLSLNSGRGLS